MKDEKNREAPGYAFQSENRIQPIHGSQKGSSAREYVSYVRFSKSRERNAHIDTHKRRVDAIPEIHKF